MRFLSRTDSTFLGHWWWTLDRHILASVFILMLLGIALIATGSPAVAQRIGAPSSHFIIYHIIYLIPAIIIMLSISMLSPKWIWRLGTLMMAGGIISLIAVLFIGTEIKGAQRWIDLSFTSIQPSEFVKPAFAISIAWILSGLSKNGDSKGKIIAFILYAVIVALLMSQPDFGMTLVISFIFFAQIFIAGAPLRYIIPVILLGTVLLALVYIFFPHVQSRIDRFLDPQSGDNYQIEQSIKSFKNGGIAGTGAGQGEVKLHLPDAHTDVIFAVAAEEMGLIFILIIIAIYGYIIKRAISRISASGDLFIITAGGGLVIMFGLQAFFHMGVSLGMLPAKGMTLPFISYGGSSLWSSSITIGMLLALTRKQVKSGISKNTIYITR